MNGVKALKENMTTPDFLVKAYLGDLSDDELMMRPVPGINHIKWQLGHLIQSEHSMVEAICPGVMPPLPEGFTAKHTKETAGSDDPKGFLKKDEYLKLYDAVRAGTVKALERTTDDELDKPGPESMRAYAPTVGAIYMLQPQHWLMHAGQWAVLRRKLGRAPLM